MSLRVAFDLDGVLADLGTGYDAVAAKHGVDLASVIVPRGSRGTLVGALHLDVLIDDTVQHCVDVIAASEATSFLVLRKPDAMIEGNAERLGISVVRTVAECLDVLEERQRQPSNPKLLDRLKQTLRSP